MTTLEQARDAVDEAVSHWFAMQLLAVDDAPKQRASTAYTAALTALITVVEREKAASMPCYYPNTAALIIPCVGRPRERICFTCTARAEKADAKEERA